MEKEFLKFVAEIMGVDESELSMETKYKEFEPWDSLMMMTLIMELEAEYDIDIPIERIGDYKMLQDLFQLIEKQSR